MFAGQKLYDSKKLRILKLNVFFLSWVAGYPLYYYEKVPIKVVLSVKIKNYSILQRLTIKKHRNYLNISGLVFICVNKKCNFTAITKVLPLIIKLLWQKTKKTLQVNQLK